MRTKLMSEVVKIVTAHKGSNCGLFATSVNQIRSNRFLAISLITLVGISAYTVVKEYYVNKAAHKKEGGKL